MAAGVALLSLALYVFIVLSLRGVLQKHLGYALPNWLVVGLITGHAGLAVASALDEVSVQLIPFSIALVWMGSLVVAVSLIALGLKLLTIGQSLGLPGPIFSCLVILEGLFFGTMVLVIPAIYTAVLADCVLGIIFLRLGESHLSPVVQAA